MQINKYSLHSYLYKSLVDLSSILISSKLCCKLDSFADSIDNMKSSNGKKYDTNNTNLSITAVLSGTVNNTLKTIISRWATSNHILTTFPKVILLT